MIQTKLYDSLRDLFGFLRIDSQGCFVNDIAESAVAGAMITQNHECGGPLFPTFTLVRAGGAAADGVQTLLTVQAINAGVVGSSREADFEPVRFAWRADRHHTYQVRVVEKRFRSEQ